jgi:hypothetical protein
LRGIAVNPYKPDRGVTYFEGHQKGAIHLFRADRFFLRYMDYSSARFKVHSQQFEDQSFLAREWMAAGD